MHPLLAEENEQKSRGEGYNQGVHTPTKQIDCERHKEETLCTTNCKRSLPAAMIKSSVTKGFEEILKGSLAYLEYNPPVTVKQICGVHPHTRAHTHNTNPYKTHTRTSVCDRELTRLDVYSILIDFTAGSSTVK